MSDGNGETPEASRRQARNEALLEVFRERADAKAGVEQWRFCNHEAPCQREAILTRGEFSATLPPRAIRA